MITYNTVPGISYARHATSSALDPDSLNPKPDPDPAFQVDMDLEFWRPKIKEEKTYSWKNVRYPVYLFLIKNSNSTSTYP